MVLIILDSLIQKLYIILYILQVYPDNAIKKELNKKQVKCLNPGCSWHGDFKDMDVSLFFIISDWTFRKKKSPYYMFAVLLQ